jgi:hypothetical protein
MVFGNMWNLWEPGHEAIDMDIPSGYVKIAIENGPVEIVDVPYLPS